MKIGDFIEISARPEVYKLYYSTYPKDLVYQISDILELESGRIIVVAPFYEDGKKKAMSAYKEDVRVVDMVAGVEDLL